VKSWLPYLVPTREQRVAYESARPAAGGVEAFWFAEEIRLHQEHQRMLEAKRAARRALVADMTDVDAA